MTRGRKLLLYGVGGIVIVSLLWIGVKTGDVHDESSPREQSPQTEATVQPSPERADPQASVSPSVESSPSPSPIEFVPATTPAPSLRQETQPEAAPSHKTEPEQPPRTVEESSEPSSSEPSSEGEKPKAAYDDLIAGTENRLRAMEGEAANYFFDTATQYLQAKDADEKSRLKKEALGKMAQFDSRFNGMMAALETQLKENGYDTSKVQEFRSAYQAEKASGQAQLGTLKN